MSRPLDRLKHHVSGAIKRGEKQAITAILPKHIVRDKIIENLFNIVDRAHHGCDDENCALAAHLENGDVFEAIQCWVESGASDEDFNKKYGRYKTFILRQIGRTI